MIKFEKVSLKQFIEDCHRCEINVDDNELEDIWLHLPLPSRSTKNSAGYDFSSPFDIDIVNFYKAKSYPTGIRVILPSNAVLLLMPRSGYGFQTGIRLANTLGVIDADYQYAKNEGHIHVKFVPGFEDKHFNQYDKFMQGIIVNYLITDDDDANKERTGGFGSTGN